MKCKKCIYIERFGKKGKNEYYNKCALLDIYNLDEEQDDKCEYYETVTLVKYPDEEDIKSETIII